MVFQGATDLPTEPCQAQADTGDDGLRNVTIMGHAEDRRFDSSSFLQNPDASVLNNHDFRNVCFLEICCVNANNARNKSVEICNLAAELNFDILCITETHYNLYSDILMVNGYEAFASFKQHGGGGVCQWIKKKWNPRVIDIPVNNPEAPQGSVIWTEFG